MSEPNRLHKQVAKMIATESALEELLDELAQCSEDYKDVCDLLRDIRSTSTAQHKELLSRFSAIEGTEIAPREDFLGGSISSEKYPATAALSHASAALSRAITGYAMLRSISLRYRDSSLIAKENTGDLAEQHTKNYVGAVHRIYQVLHNAVLWEMDQDGESCQCTCPSCGLGICMCAQGPRRTLSDIWAEVGPISDEKSVYVHQPRSDSAAAKAGLIAGDTLLEADGKTLETHFILQGIVSGHSSGEPIEFQVKHASGDLERVKIALP